LLALELAVAEGDAVCVFEEELEAVAVFDRVKPGVPDTAPERDAGNADTVRVSAARAVREPPMERVTENDPEELLVARGDAVSDGVALAERELRIDLEGEAVVDTDGVSENERVCEGVAEAHAVAVAVGDAVRVTPGVREAEGHSDCVCEPRPLRLAELEAEPPGEPLPLSVGQAVGLNVGAKENEGRAVEVGTTRSTSAMPRYSRPSFGARTSDT